MIAASEPVQRRPDRTGGSAATQDLEGIRGTTAVRPQNRPSEGADSAAPRGRIAGAVGAPRLHGRSRAQCRPRPRPGRPQYGRAAHRPVARRGQRTFAGTAQQVADTVGHWYERGAADGFNIMPAVLPSGLERFVDEVVPILQERGLFRTEYTGSTLREHYGLPRPANRLFDTVDSSAGHPGITLTEVR